MQNKTLKVHLELFEEALATSPANEDLLSTYITSRAPSPEHASEEAEALGAADAEEKAMTVFPKENDGTPFFWDYQIKGMFKDSCQMLAKAGKAGYEGGKHCAELKAYKKAIDGLVFVAPRRIDIDLHGLRMGTCCRPLRASTPKGERISLAKSETAPEGSTLEFDLQLLDPTLEGMILECLEYGKLRGLSQWRNSGKGRFFYSIMDDNGNVVKTNKED